MSDKRADLAEVRALLFAFGKVDRSNVRHILQTLADVGHADARVEMHPDGVRVVKLTHSEPDCQSATVEIAWHQSAPESFRKGVIDIGNQKCPTCNGTGHVGGY